MPTNGKDTIYIDIDDEITSVIEKVRASDAKIIALVLPKRATVLQSIVNMKLLKRSADASKKSIVLITGEAGLLPMAGAVGFHVAKTLQSKPEIPTGANTEEDEVIDETPVETPDDDDESEVTAANSGNRPVGELAAASGGAAAARAKNEDIETVALDDTNDGDDKAVSDDGKADTDKPKKPKKDKKLAVPSFDKFRLRLVLAGVVLVALIVLFYVCNSILPKATITLTTDTSDINTSLTLNLDTTAKTLDQTTDTVPATLQKVDKSGSQQVSTTGKKNNGTPASGKVTLSLPDCSISQVDVPAGTGVTANGLTFITQDDASLSSVQVGSSCKNSSFPSFSSATVSVTAQQSGSNYNVQPTTFKVAGYPGVAASSDNAMTGGTDNIIQIVAQADIDSAKQKITSQNSSSVKSQLQSQLKSAGLLAVTSTFTAGDPTITTSANVGDQATTLTVTEVTTYSMLGVKQSDLKTLVDADVTKHIDPSKQSILTEGLSSATFHVDNTTANGAQIAFATTATAGPDLSADDIKKAAAGKKSGDVTSALKADPGVTDVNVKLSPFWVTSVPSKASKVTVTFQKSGQ